MPISGYITASRSPGTLDVVSSNKSPTVLCNQAYPESPPRFVMRTSGFSTADFPGNDVALDFRGSFPDFGQFGIPEIPFHLDSRAYIPNRHGSAPLESQTRIAISEANSLAHGGFLRKALPLILQPGRLVHHVAGQLRYSSPYPPVYAESPETWRRDWPNCFRSFAYSERSFIGSLGDAHGHGADADPPSVQGDQKLLKPFCRFCPRYFHGEPAHFPTPVRSYWNCGAPAFT